jgi:transcription elongation factor Elf1
MEDLVPKEWGCPHCGERHYDLLVAPNDDGVTHCETCFTKYNIETRTIVVRGIALNSVQQEQDWADEKQLESDLRSPPS